MIQVRGINSDIYKQLLLYYLFVCRSTVMATSQNDDIPQWKKDLILRKRNQSKCLAGSKQLCAGPPQNLSGAIGRVGQQPSKTNAVSNSASVSSPAVASVCGVPSVPKQCNLPHDHTGSKMVQERSWLVKQHSCELVSNGDEKSDSETSEEDLHYGPGIVNKLKNRYLSLALRESNVRSRPTILPMRKATSLENLLENDEGSRKETARGNRVFDTRMNGSNDTTRNVPNRYRNTARAEMKRAHSVETISRDNHENLYTESTKPKRESLHEEMLIISKEGNGLSNRKIQEHFDNKKVEVPVDNKIYTRVNRPKRITPIMNEKEKPPVDVVKQVKRIFEGRPEQRTRPPHATGEVAAKVATYKSIIVQTKVNKKPIIKQKPANITSNDKIRKTNHAPVRLPTSKTAWNEKRSAPENQKTLPSPIPDISRISEFEDAMKNGHKTTSSLSETPDLILHSSPAITSPKYKVDATKKFLREEIMNSVYNGKKEPVVMKEIGEDEVIKYISTESRTNISKSSSTVTYNFSKPPSSPLRTSSPIPITQPLKLEINGTRYDETPKSPSPRINHVINEPPRPTTPKPVLTVREIEKNFINSAKTLEQPVLKTTVSVSAESVTVATVPKVKKPARTQEQNSVVFKFTDRQDVPDYVGNDGRVRTSKIERPKTGEGGIIILPGASLDESFTDDDDDWQRSLEGPPSPCDVLFINDNILIDGKSSLSQKTKKQKMKISFVEAVPEIFEYPSETSLLIEETSILLSSPLQSPSASPSSPVGHTVPSLAGSTLANYMPKAGNLVEDFQLGVTRTVVSVSSVPKIEQEETLQPLEEPILFSAGTNSDILF